MSKKILLFITAIISVMLIQTACPPPPADNPDDSDDYSVNLPDLGDAIDKTFGKNGYLDLKGWQNLTYDEFNERFYLVDVSLENVVTIYAYDMSGDVIGEFGNNGALVLNTPHINVTRLAVADSGNKLLVGYSVVNFEDMPPYFENGIICYTKSGIIDNEFGTEGKFVLPEDYYKFTEDFYNGVASYETGDYIYYFYEGSKLERISAVTGIKDTSFGTSGTVTIANSIIYAGYIHVFDTYIYCYNSSPTIDDEEGLFQMDRSTVNGANDTSFESGGTLFISIDTDNNLEPYFLSDGSFIVFDDYSSGTGYELHKYNDNVVEDSAYITSGMFESTEKLIAFGSSVFSYYDNSTAGVNIYKQFNDGTSDTIFGDNGVLSFVVNDSDWIGYNLGSIIPADNVDNFISIVYEVKSGEMYSIVLKSKGGL